MFVAAIAQHQLATSASPFDCWKGTYPSIDEQHISDERGEQNPPRCVFSV
jgi:hypothetical protein